MGRASSSALDELHRLTIESIGEEIKRAREAASQPQTIKVEGVDQPNPAYRPMNPQLLDKALKVLKDNGIDSPAKGGAAHGLADILSGADVDLDAAAMRIN